MTSKDVFEVEILDVLARTIGLGPSVGISDFLAWFYISSFISFIIMFKLTFSI